MPNALSPFRQRVRLSAAIGFSLCSLLMFAGEADPPIKWGDIARDDLAMKSFPTDSNANAVILCDYGRLWFDRELNPIYERHMRIKILRQAGYAWGTHSIEYYAEDGAQRLKEIEAVTYALNSDGETVRTKMDKAAIFDEETSAGWERIKFTLPALSPGCVVEFRYTIVSNNPVYLPSWSFQTSEPTLWSEFRVKCPNIFGYGIVWQGYEPFVVREEDEFKEFFNVAGIESALPVRYNRWAIKNAPAIREEAYVTTIDDYSTKLVMNLSSAAYPGIPVQRFSDTWEKLTESLMNHSRFGKQLKGYGAVKKKIDALTTGVDHPMKKAREIYDFVRTTIVWNEKYRYFVEKDLDDVLESKSGNSAEINLLLTLMLREAGIQANPVVLSTRLNGRVQKLYPIYTQFDYVIAQANLGGKPVLLDATDRLRPFYLLPARALNHIGWSLIDETKHEWIPIESSGRLRSTTVATLALHEDGSLSGQVEKEFSDYRALNQRRNLAEKKDAEYITWLFETETSGIAVDSFTIAGRDSVDGPLRIVAKVSAPTYAQALNDFIYVNPMVTVRYTENPLKLSKRSFPVDIEYGQQAVFYLTLTLPNGYEVKELPKDYSMLLPQNGGSYIRKCSQDANVVQVQTKYLLSQLLFEPKQYSTLKEFWDRRVAMEAEQIVLQKKATPVQQAPQQAKGKPESRPKKK